jgi:phosphoribosylanthranilate isomerase
VATTVELVFVKICGITRPADAIAAWAAGADAIGLNFVPESRRRIDLTTARTIVDTTPAGVMRVGVFRNHPTAEILDIIASLDLDSAQLHGHHPPEEATAITAAVRTLILAMTVDDVPLRDLDHHPEHVLMLDGPASGSGQTFDWSTIGDLTATRRVLLAGGLTPDNVADAVHHVRPWGVDVATGPETAPGHKDHDAVARFVTRARTASETT